jgi:hypothetical protein
MNFQNSFLKQSKRLKSKSSKLIFLQASEQRCSKMQIKNFLKCKIKLFKEKVQKITNNLNQKIVKSLETIKIEKK